MDGSGIIEEEKPEIEEPETSLEIACAKSNWIFAPSPAFRSIGKVNSAIVDGLSSQRLLENAFGRPPVFPPNIPGDRVHVICPALSVMIPGEYC